MADWLQVLIAFYVPIIGFVGVVVGARLTARREDKKWRLDIKYDLYLRIARSSETLRSCLLEIVEPHELASMKWRDRGPINDRYGAALDDFFAAMPEVSVVASPKVFSALADYTSLIVEVVDSAGPTGAPDVEYLRAFGKLSSSTAILSNAMREDLGFGEDLPTPASDLNKLLDRAGESPETFENS